MANDWRFEHEEGAEGVPPWLLVAPGARGATHRAAVFLARMRQSVEPVGEGDDRRDHSAGYQSFQFIVDTVWEAPEVVSAALEVLRINDLAESRTTPGGEAWRATPELVAVMDEALRRRDPTSG